MPVYARAALAFTVNIELFLFNQFGGKLITFENDKEAVAQALQNAQPGHPPVPIHRAVYVSQVITEPVLVKKSSELEKALEYGNFTGKNFTNHNNISHFKPS